jgi:hypothetical protein
MKIYILDYTGNEWNCICIKNETSLRGEKIFGIAELNYVLDDVTVFPVFSIERSV